MTDPAKPPTALQKFRKTYVRHDFYPGDAARLGIERMRRAYPGRSTRELLDALVIAGAKSLLPESPA